MPAEFVTRSGALSAPVPGDPEDPPSAQSPGPEIKAFITLTNDTATRAAEDDEKEDEEIPTAPSSLTSSLLSCSTPSISSSTTTDTSVTSDINHALGAMDKIYEDKSQEGENVNTMSTATITDTKNADTSMPSRLSSSSTSLPALPPTASSSASNVVDSSASSSPVSSLLHRQPVPNLNVKFAPLPEMAPRKRKSHTPLGMAARGQLARRRRALAEGYDDDEYYDYNYNANPQPAGYMITAEEERRMEEKARRKAQRAAADLSREAAEEEEENQEVRWKRDPNNDPFVALARKMGKAGKHIWRKVSSKETKDGIEGTGESGTDEENKEHQSGTATLAATTTTNGEGKQSREGRQSREQGDESKKSQEMRPKHSISRELGSESPPSVPSSNVPASILTQEPKKVIPSPVTGKSLPRPPHPPTAATPVPLPSS